MRYMTVGFKRTVSLVILPIDDFTEQVIADSKIRVYTEQGKHLSICKEDGYRVFCDLRGNTVRICAEGPLYQKQAAEFPVGDASTVFKLRMLPNANYPIPRGATCIRGRMKPGSRIRLFFPEQKKIYKLLYDYVPNEQECSLSLFMPELVHLEGKSLYIQSRDEEGEFFRVTGQMDEKIQIDGVLKKGYKKIGTTIYPVYEAETGEDGSFYLPIRGLAEGENTCICTISEKDGQNEFCRKLLLQTGKENRITEEICMEEICMEEIS